jgi:predicted naringenin-chalcone synthase
MAIAPVLTGFHITPPPYRVEQAKILAWLREAHAEAEARIAGLDPAARAAFAEQLGRVLERVACGPDKIRTRGVSVPDTDVGWANHIIYDLIADPRGAGSRKRTEQFAALIDAYFATAYAREPDTAAPDDLIHVTCTGYVSPSGAQKLVASRAWPTRVTHAYHMGCYAAIPAIRIADGLLAATSGGARRRVDIAHTELCSLHLDPADHRVATLVVHSLFADGLIRYSMLSEATPATGPALRLRAIHEQLVPDSESAMTWIVGNHGMQMTLSVDVPAKIASVLRPFMTELLARAGYRLDQLRDAVVAVHPGGPKIIDRVRDGLELDERQVAASRNVLLHHGNMSSATLPHIWERILHDPAVPAGTMIPSLAFGPGLTICGAVFEKV